MKKWFNLVAILSLLFLVSCNSETGGTVQKAEDTGTGGVQTIEPGSETKQHSDIFMKTRLHGKSFLKAKEFCMNCHGKDLQGTDKAPSCTTCHATYPHDADFLKIKTGKHGGIAAEAGVATCFKCHDNKDADPKVPKVNGCFKCHTNYPHTSENWSERNGHGKKISESPDFKETKKCLKCHGDNSWLKKNAPEKFVSCNDCHKGYPHAADFLEVETGMHGGISAKIGAKNCLKCHGDKEASDKITRCFDCHSNYPHLTENWGEREGHGKQVSGSDDSNEASSCLNCHGDNSWIKKNDPDNFISCNDCHTSYPHAKEFKKGGHAVNFFDSEGNHKPKEGLSSCTNCHSTEVSKTKIKGCNDCHLGYPHLKENWEDQLVHGTAYTSATNENQKQSCAKCHTGETWREKNIPNVSAYKCTDCHEVFPAEHLNKMFAWAKHSNFVDRNVESIQANCTGCHRNYTANLPTKISDGNCTIKCHKPDGYNRLPKLPN